MSELTKADLLRSLHFLQNPRIIVSADDVDHEAASRIPDSWLGLLSLNKVDLSRLQELWRPVQTKLPKIMAALERTLKGTVLLLEQNQPPSLLYIYSEEGEIYHHRGFPPLEEKDIPQKMTEVWSQLPAELRRLYEIHNGWFFAVAKSMGHLPVGDWFFLSEEEWDLSDEALTNLPLDLEHTIAIFSNGGGGYICLGLPTEDRAGTIEPLAWWSDEPANPDFANDFWTLYDSWTAIHFEQVDPQ